MTVMDTSFSAPTLTQLLLVVLSISHPVVSGSNSGIFLNREAFLPTNIEATTERLASSIHVTCTKTGINVSFKRNDVIDMGVVSPSQLRLLDPDCISSINITHFSLHTGFQECNTEVEISNDKRMATTKNAVLISPPEAVFDTDDDVSEPDGGRTAEIRFACTYNTAPVMTTEASMRPAAISSIATQRVATATTTPLLTSAQNITRAGIRLFSTDSYAQEINVRDEPITRGTSLYAKIEAFSGLDIAQGFFISSCYLSRVPSANQSTEVHYLIRKGCPSDSDVQLKQDASYTQRKFLFRAKRLYGNKAMYLHCSLVPCHASQECTSQQSFCNMNIEEISTTGFLTSIRNGLYVIKRQRNVPQQISLPPSTKKALPEMQTRQSPVPTQMPMSCPPAKPVECSCSPPLAAGVQQSTHSSSQSSETHNSSSTMISIHLTIVATVVAFLIGVSLIGFIWYLHTKTDPRRKMQAVAMSDDGSSSQESTVPTVKLMSTTTTTSSYDS